MWSRVWVVVVVLAVGLLAGRAHAGPVEQMVQVAFHPTDPKSMAVRYINGYDGILRTSDGGKSWQLVCDSQMFDAVSTHSGSIAFAGDGTTMMGVFNGMFHDDAHGCAWSGEAQFTGEWIGDIAPDPVDPSMTYAITSTASKPGEHKLNGLFRRDKSGAWTAIGQKDELLATRLHVIAHGSGHRIYVGAIRLVTPDDGGFPYSDYVTRVSDDEGATWQEFEYGPSDGQLRIMGVDPTNPDRIIASVNRVQGGSSTGGDEDTVLVSSDKGAHFTEYLKVTEIGGVAFTPDGQVFIGDSGDTTDPMRPRGLWAAKNLDTAPQALPKATYPVQCLGYQAATKTLYACQHFYFGSVDPSDGGFSSLIKFTEMKDFVSCPGTSVAATCQMQMCNAYCGFGHFGVAPLCCNYNTDTCGVPVIQSETSGDAGAICGATAAGGSGGGGAAGAKGGSAGAIDAGTTTSGSGGAGALADGGTAPAKKSGCSCHVLAPGLSGVQDALGSSLALFGALFWVRRRGRG